MTSYAQDSFTVVEVSSNSLAAAFRLRGDLDYVSAEDLLTVVTARLRQAPAPREIRLDCAGLGICDSTGLSVLLVIRRRADAVGTRLHLDNRGAALNRLLDITGTREHLVAGRDGVHSS
ncbi:STAS domain-containing protein [Nonomuraea soli]|uniref:Anti-anti-sigma factor n=1 Tax=Nonomuraea soli TaxID=1032476 RepID=A0A7W0CKH0_9ACTN|nr:STAS domain-containing protein [Nonomuraea soli]MBA2892851.1 anti-anti-sigma factor [Nonomuraea soli]